MEVKNGKKKLMMSLWWTLGLKIQKQNPTQKPWKKSNLCSLRKGKKVQIDQIEKKMDKSKKQPPPAVSLLHYKIKNQFHQKNTDQ